jgi:hypothetical protein
MELTKDDCVARMADGESAAPLDTPVNQEKVTPAPDLPPNRWRQGRYTF